MIENIFPRIHKSDQNAIWEMEQKNTKANAIT